MASFRCDEQASRQAKRCRHCPGKVCLYYSGTVLPPELDAYYAKLYGLTGDALHYILDPASIMARITPAKPSAC
ncbi:hypothetical protein ASA_P5G094 (plasmid) [Aeromonas salmonicida subsp. salmonicida A449]|uniref:Uncharacterized protein n=1 Tax=Aeromonas salmonicida (strain A449) TaxID=382245 RepID=A4SUJ4_AERS4|nr:hypothetical protein ASA_P5G094 [Aeromonas salmonicida subsp. salmonicida A449]ASI21548.1 hypothetical protein CE456_01510 [Aeromonas salmonicida]ASI25915.1 hypothetical protein CE463_01855 [Aeromonas salmonicida]ASI30012.1 hypothetical protein CE462_00630 [Aeromonas salmonicida]PMU03350.1 hypothetical protein CJI17_20295 [Aeromonas salmonicida]